MAQQFNFVSNLTGLAPEGQKDTVFGIGRRIFEKAAQNLSRAEGLHYINSSVLSLMESSCCGYHRASYVLAVIFEVGLGMPIDTAQVRFGCFKRELILT